MSMADYTGKRLILHYIRTSEETFDIPHFRDLRLVHGIPHIIPGSVRITELIDGVAKLEYQQQFEWTVIIGSGPSAISDAIANAFEHSYCFASGATVESIRFEVRDNG